MRQTIVFHLHRRRGDVLEKEIPCICIRRSHRYSYADEKNHCLQISLTEKIISARPAEIDDDCWRSSRQARSGKCIRNVDNFATKSYHLN